MFPLIMDSYERSLLQETTFGQLLNQEFPKISDFLPIIAASSATVPEMVAVISAFDIN